MKLKAYFLMASVLLSGVSAVGIRDAKPVEGVHPGDLAPRIELSGKGQPAIYFQNPDGRYTLVHFWAAYDAESRARNVLLWNKVNRLNATGKGKVAMYSISFDEASSVFEGTIRTDKLVGTTQLHEAEGRHSDLFRTYGLEKGVKNLLINDEGVIIASNVSPDELAQLCDRI